MHLSPHLSRLAEREIVIIGETHVSPERFYAAWIDAEAYPRWFCPKPGYVSDVKLDVRTGGFNSMKICGPDGKRFPHRGVYLEVIPNQRLVFTDCFFADWEPNPEFMFVGILTFEPCSTAALPTQQRLAIELKKPAKNTQIWASTTVGIRPLISLWNWSERCRIESRHQCWQNKAMTQLLVRGNFQVIAEEAQDRSDGADFADNVNYPRMNGGRFKPNNLCQWLMLSLQLPHWVSGLPLARIIPPHPAANY